MIALAQIRLPHRFALSFTRRRRRRRLSVTFNEVIRVRSAH